MRESLNYLYLNQLDFLIISKNTQSHILLPCMLLKINFIGLLDNSNHTHTVIPLTFSLKHYEQLEKWSDKKQ